MYYKSCNEKDKNELKKVIKNGQLEIVNGGWIQQDQASATYEDMLDNMMLG